MCVKLKQCLRESYRKKKCLLRSLRLRTVLPRSTLWYCCAVKPTASLSDLALTSSNLKRIFPDPHCANSIVFACLSLLKWVSFCISSFSSSWKKWLAKYICSEKSGGYIFPRSRKRDNFVLVDHCLDHCATWESKVESQTSFRRGTVSCVWDDITGAGSLMLSSSSIARVT